MSGFIQWLNALAATHPVGAYLILFLSATIENLFPPIPGDTVTIFGAYLVGRGSLSLWPVVYSTLAGSAAGCLGLYFFGRTYGRDALMRLKWVQRSGDKITHAERLCRRHGTLVVLVNRFLPGLRTVVSITIGLLRMPLWQVVPASVIGIFAWNGLLIWGGLTAGENWEQVVAIMNRFNMQFGILIAVALVAAAGWWWKKKRPRAATLDGERER